jgi:hypothetical protein
VPACADANSTTRVTGMRVAPGDGLAWALVAALVATSNTPTTRAVRIVIRVKAFMKASGLRVPFGSPAYPGSPFAKDSPRPARPSSRTQHRSGRVRALSRAREVLLK